MNAGNLSPPTANDFGLSFTHPVTRAGSAYWQQRRGNRILPDVAEFCVRDMRSFITHVMLIDVSDPCWPVPGYRVRLAGDDVRKTFGDIKGKWLHQFLSPEVESRWRSALNAAIATKSPLRNYGFLLFESRSWTQYEVLVAPTGSGTEITGLFVIFVDWPRHAASCHIASSAA